jgi:hypothetical protein
MAELFDDISRIVGSQIPRRKALRLISSAFVGAALGVTVKGRTHSPAAPDSYSMCCPGLGGVCHITQPPWVKCEEVNSESECRGYGAGHNWYAYGVVCPGDELCCKVNETCCGKVCCQKDERCIDGVCCSNPYRCLDDTKCCQHPRICIYGTICCDTNNEVIMTDDAGNTICCPNIRVCRVNNAWICCPRGQPCCDRTACCPNGCDSYGRCNNPTPMRP